MENLAQLATESVNPATADIDTRSTQEIVELINAEDARVAAAVEAELPHIAQAVDLISERMAAGGLLMMACHSLARSTTRIRLRISSISRTAPVILDLASEEEMSCRPVNSNLPPTRRNSRISMVSWC